MSNVDLIREFKAGKHKGIASHLYIKGDKLINYDTVICFRDKDGKFHLNIKKYSSSTSRIQSDCRWILGDDIVEEYEGENCTYWNFGYQGAPQIKASDVY